MTEVVPRRRFVLRDLPLPAKLVVSLFLISVGVGYFSALVQLHMQHSTRNGDPMPTVGDVIEKFSGLKEFDGNRPQSKLETILAGPADGAFDKNNMSPAFFAKSSGYDKECKAHGKANVDGDRAAEKAALIAWIQLDPAPKKAAYAANTFPLPEGAVEPPEEYFDKATRLVKVESIFTDRCAKCHAGEQKPDLDEYAKIEPLVTPPPMEVIDQKWVRSTRQVSVEGLASSTHTHLLSFSMLFSLTGIVFAFSSYPAVLRASLGPVVLLAQLADISCWWLARLDTVGPTFATMIVGTGGVVGLGLAAQIVLGLFDLYGKKGKGVLALVALTAIGAFLTLVVTVIEPTLKAEREKAAAPKVQVTAPAVEKPEPKPAKDAAKPADNGPGEIPKAV